MTGKARNVALITLAQVLALSLWFSSTAAGPAMLAEAPGRGNFYQALLTSAVQAGFVLGTLVSAALALPDRFDPRRVFAIAALLGAAANGAILLLPPGADGVIAARFVTGMALAGVYPVGMKLAAGWADRGDMGLTLGSAAPHLVSALGGVASRPVLAVASLTAVAAALLVGVVRLGPRHAPAPPFRPAAALGLFRNRGTRLATLGYLGHMWKLCAMWAWIGLYFAASFAAWRGTGGPVASEAALATFAVIAVGALGSVAAGLTADRVGRVRVTVAAMAVSGACCLLAGPVFGLHPALVMLLGLVWGVAVVAEVSYQS